VSVEVLRYLREKGLLRLTSGELVALCCRQKHVSRELADFLLECSSLEEAGPLFFVGGHAGLVRYCISKGFLLTLTASSLYEVLCYRPVSLWYSGSQLLELLLLIHEYDKDHLLPDILKRRLYRDIFRALSASDLRRCCSLGIVTEDFLTNCADMSLFESSRSNSLERLRFLIEEKGVRLKPAMGRKPRRRDVLEYAQEKNLFPLPAKGKKQTKRQKSVEIVAM
jgi:hypothetical protein